MTAASWMLRYPAGGGKDESERGVAQYGSALGLGPRGREFKSRRPDRWQGWHLFLRP